MTTEGSVSIYRAAAELWKRAPIWRASLMLAGLLSLLFILCPPTLHQTSDVATPAISDQAEYNPVRKPPTAAPNEKAIDTGMPVKADDPGIDASLLGPLYSNSIEIGGFKLPLPDGNWAVLANNKKIDFQTSSGESYFLGRIVHRRLVGTVVVYALKIKTGAAKMADVILPTHGCDFPGALYDQKNPAASKENLSCWYVYAFFTPIWSKWNDHAVQMTWLERTGAENMAAMGISSPQDMLAVAFLRRETWGSIYAIYHFSPDSDGLVSNAVSTFRDSDWAPGNLQRFPDKLAYVEKIKSWATSFWPRFASAFMDGKSSR